MMHLGRRVGAGRLATVITAVWVVWSAALGAGPACAEEKGAAILGFLQDGDSTLAITMTTVAPGMVRVFGRNWEGAGLTDGTSYWGVFRAHDSNGRSESKGTHRGTFRPDGSIAIHGEYSEGHVGSFDVLWKRVPMEKGQPVPPAPPRAVSTDPALGDYVYVEELPEALTKVPPAYPAEARRAKVEGTVLVQALVGKDGRVRDTKIVRSIPELDDAAVAAVRQWVFKPALAKGSPVAVWVAVPVRFTLQ
jgi:TonB family protein